MRESPWPLVLRWWIGWLAGVVLVGMALSIPGKLGWVGIATLAWSLGWTLWIWKHEGSLSRYSWRDLLPPWPVILVLLVALLSLASGLAAMLDSLTYRIPQLYLWLQEGHPVWVENVDPRINGMPHVWSLVAAPFYLLLGERALALPSWISLFILYGALEQWGSVLGVSREPARWIAAIFAGSVGFGLQAMSTDNALFISALLAAGSVLCVQNESQGLGRGKWSDIGYSSLALALTSGSKPQYAALGVFWLVWFFAAPSRPWQRLPLLVWPWLATAGLCVSFLPAWIAAKGYGGTLGAVEISFRLWNHEFLRAVLLSVLSFLIDLFDLPVNPFYSQITGLVQSMATSAGTSPRDALRLFVRPVAIPDSASLGLIVAIAFIFGIWKSLRGGGARTATTLATWTTAIGFFALCLARPIWGARSYVGYIVLAMPMAMEGLARLPLRGLKIWAWTAALSTLAAILFTPAHPLLPLSVFRTAMNGAKYGEVQQYYGKFHQRIECGEEMMRRLPKEDALTVYAVVDQQVPLHNLWHGETHKVCFIAPSDISSLKNARFVLLRHSTFPDESKTYERMSAWGFTLLEKTYHVEMVRAGPKPWMLFERKCTSGSASSR